MRFTLYTAVVILFASFAFPQKVAVKCAREKLLCDSIMRVQFGSVLFETCFEFDKESYVWGNENYMCEWNDWFRGDSITSYDFKYRFRFPGTQIRTQDAYPVALNSKGLEDEVPTSQPYARINKTLMNQAQMEKLANEKLRLPLRKCTSSLHYSQYFYNDSGQVSRRLDSTHVYVEIHNTHREDSRKWGSKFQVWDTVMIVDAYTAEFIGIKTSYYYGTVGGHF